MKILFIFFPIFLTISSFAKQSEPKEWFSCQSNRDCIIVEDFCSWRAINKKFENIFRKSKRLNPYECTQQTPDPDLKDKIAAGCIESFCEVHDK